MTMNGTGTRTQLAFLCATLAIVGCGSKRPPVPGGGSRVVTKIVLAVASEKPSFQVGEEVPLIVQAYWAIPSMTNSTKESVFDVRPPEMGEVSGGVFRPKQAGEVLIAATFAGFRSEIRLTIQK